MQIPNIRQFLIPNFHPIFPNGNGLILVILHAAALLDLDKFALGVVDEVVAGVAGGEVHAELGSSLYDGIREVLLVGADEDMGAGDLSGVHPDIIAFGGLEELLVLLTVASDHHLMVFDPEELSKTHLLLFALLLAPLGDEQFEVVEGIGMVDGVENVLVEVSFAFEVFLFDMDIFGLVFGTLGEVEIVVAEAVFGDIFGERNSDCIALKITGLEYLVIRFYLVKERENEIAVDTVLVCFGEQFCFIGKFGKGKVEFLYLFLDGSLFDLFALCQTLLLALLVAIFQ